MTMNWVRLDTSFGHNYKTLQLVADKKWQAIAVYTFALGYSGQHGLDGHIPRIALPIIHATPTIAAQLVDAGLWIAVDGGWHINGWDEYQPTSAEAKQRREKARMAARERWDKAKR